MKIKKIGLTFVLLSTLLLVACGGNSYQSEIDGAIKALHNEGLSSIEKKDTTFYIYEDGKYIGVENGTKLRAVKKYEDGTYEYKYEYKADIKGKKADYIEKNGEKINE